MYKDVILKHNNLELAHTKTTYDSFREILFCPIRNVWEKFSVRNVSKTKHCGLVKVQKLKK